jgi:hypothetical protein
MNTNNNRKKSLTAALGAAAAALAAPAMLFFGTGTAQAATTVAPTSNALGVTIKITSDGAQHGWCRYSAWPTAWGAVKPLPVYDIPFVLQANQSYDLWTPGIQTGSTWTAKTSCQFGGTQFHPGLTY